MQVQKVLTKLAEEGALEEAHIQLMWSLTEKQAIVELHACLLHVSGTCAHEHVLLRGLLRSMAPCPRWNCVYVTGIDTPWFHLKYAVVMMLRHNDALILNQRL